METRTETIAAKMSDGTTIYVRATVMGANEDIGLGTKSFQDVGRTIQSLAREIVQALEAVQPQKTTVEFGIEAGLESGNLVAILAKGTGNASLKVTLEWAAKD
jgi:hypothetical protein